jgi:hypothetical protein
MHVVSVVADDGSWLASPVHVAVSPAQRRLGVRTGVGRVMLRTTSVHARGLSRGLRVVAIDEAGTVLGVRALAPGRFARVRGATWLLEQALGDDQPRIGTTLSIYPHMRDRKTPALCDPDWQPE